MDREMFTFWCLARRPFTTDPNPKSTVKMRRDGQGGEQKLIPVVVFAGFDQRFRTGSTCELINTN
jgi:hypothetical protein